MTPPLPTPIPQLARLDPQLLAGKRCERGRSISQEVVDHRVGLARGEAFGLVDQFELLTLALGILGKFARLDPDLALRELARAGHRDPLPERHRARASEQARQARDEDQLRVGGGSGHAHDQAQVRAETVVRPEDRRPQRVPTHGTMAALEPAEKAPLHTPRLRQDELLEDLRVPALLRRHPRTRGLWLGDVIVLVCFLACGDGGEDQIGAYPSRDPPEHAAPPRWSAGANLGPGEAQLVLPERDVGLLHPGKVAIDSGQAAVGLTTGHRAVLRRAVDLVLPILEVAPTVLSRSHWASTPQGRPSSLRAFGPERIWAGRLDPLRESAASRAWLAGSLRESASRSRRPSRM